MKLIWFIDAAPLYSPISLLLDENRDLNTCGNTCFRYFYERAARGRVDRLVRKIITRLL